VNATVVKLVNTLDLKSSDRKILTVRFRPVAPNGNQMNIWIEYYRIEDDASHLKYHDQMNEKFVPDPQKISRRFCQNKDEAHNLAARLYEQGYHVLIKQDGSK
jgi:hypothetical protein